MSIPMAAPRYSLPARITPLCSVCFAFFVCLQVLATDIHFIFAHPVLSGLRPHTGAVHSVDTGMPVMDPESPVMKLEWQALDMT